MAIITTKAIVLSAIKYGDTSLIVKSYTEKEGLKTYLVRGILKSKKAKLKPAYFQPLTQLDIVASHKPKSNLHSIREAQVINPYQTIYKNIKKQTIALFLSEVLYLTIKEEEQNQHLYTYLETAFIWLDTHEKVANFHLLFLLNFTRFLGFYPDTSNKHKKGFNLADGNFTDFLEEKCIISNTEIYQFKKLLGINFDGIELVSFSKQERQTVLKTIIKYFELHLAGFKSPKSLNILKTIFS